MARAHAAYAYEIASVGGSHLSSTISYATHTSSSPLAQVEKRVQNQVEIDSSIQTELERETRFSYKLEAGLGGWMQSVHFYSQKLML